MISDNLDIVHSLLDIGHLHVFHRVWQLIKSRVAINFVVRWVEKRLCIFCRSMDMGRFNHPDTNALISAAIHVARVLQSHLGISRMQASNVFVAKALFGSDKNFPEGPVFHGMMILN